MRTFWLSLLLVFVLTARGDDPWRLLFMGDTGLASTYPGTELDLQQLGRMVDDSAIAFENLRPFMVGHDAVIINLETALGEGLTSPLVGRKDYLHLDPPLTTARLLGAHGVTVASLGNNHASDFGLAGLRETRQALDVAGITAIGAGDTLAQAARPWVFDPPGCQRPVAVFALFEARDTYARKYGWFAAEETGGVAGFDAERLRRQIELLRARQPQVFVVLFPHWGSNYRYRRERQVQMAHQAIEAGVDLILGHGAHLLQEIELYRGRWIVYGLGNGVFLSPGRFAMARNPGYSALGQLLVSAEGPRALRLFPILGDNQQTGYRPRFLDADEAEACWADLLTRSKLPLEQLRLLQRGQSAERFYLEIPLQSGEHP